MENVYQLCTSTEDCLGTSLQSREIQIMLEYIQTNCVIFKADLPTQQS